MVNSSEEKNVSLYFSALKGDIEAAYELYNIYIQSNMRTLEIEGVKEVFLTRAAVLRVLNHLKNKDYEEQKVGIWGRMFWDFFRHYSPSVEKDEDTNDVVYRLHELGDAIDGTIESDELEDMIRLMSLPDVWDLETAKNAF